MRLATTPVDPLFIAFQQALAGKYSLDRELGRGGMGIVYLAREVHLDRLVAIKMLPPELASDQTLRDRFLREARLAARLSHPNIIPIHAVEEIGGFVFFVMAFIDGETLQHRVRTRGPLPAGEAVRVLRDVAWALAYAHGEGVVHRDIKPENILLESSTGRVLVADFGIAGIAGDDDIGVVTGTPDYMSPEQALGKPVDARSDLYSLGTTAFFMCSGRLPFEGGTTTELLARHITEAPPQLSGVVSTVPRKMALLVDRCLSKDPARRPGTAQALAEELNASLEQRRELPAALRAFVKRQARLNGGGTLIACLALFPAAITAGSLYGADAGWVTLGVGGLVLPFTYFVVAARRLMALGFAHADIGPAFRRELEQASEELSVTRQVRRGRLEQALEVGARVAGFAGAATLAAGLTGMLGGSAITYGALSMGAGMLGALGLIHLKGRYEDVDTGFWSKVWLGRTGRAAFAIAGKLLGSRVRPAPVTHRPTELALGMAAEQLFASLSSEVRSSLGDVPARLRHMQDAARRLRERRDELQQALGETSADDDSAFADLRAMLDQVQAKLADTVTALETIRLDLLRLHAGSVSVERLTTQLAMVIDLSNEVDRLVTARDEVERAARTLG